jgi:hypothetical protein
VFNPLLETDTALQGQGRRQDLARNSTSASAKRGVNIKTLSFGLTLISQSTVSMRNLVCAVTRKEEEEKSRAVGTLMPLIRGKSLVDCGGLRRACFKSHQPR